MTRLSNVGQRLSQFQVGKFRYNSPWTQVALVGFVCFCSVGMFSAISNLGAGGTQDVTTSNISNGVLYGVFAISGFFAGSINNVLGPRLTLSIGTMGYSLYLGSLWAFQVHGSKAFLIAAGGILGFTAALLWSAQGAIMLSYPMEKDKGRSFSLFWTIFSMGGVVGSGITLALEAKQSAGGAVSTGVYLAFIIIMLTAIFSSWLILPPNYVVRGDGTVVELQAALSVARETKEFFKLFKDWRMLALFPMFFVSNYFYVSILTSNLRANKQAYQASIISAMFVPRARALASLVTNVGAVIGAILIGLLLDMLPGNRRKRTLITFFILVLGQAVMWGSGIAWQRQWERKEHGGPAKGLQMDWDTGKAPGIFCLLLGYYLVDAAYQGLAYYIMGSITNDSFRLARMTGYYKGVQSAGAAVSYGMDAVHTPYLTSVIVVFCMIMFTFITTFPVVWVTRCSDEEKEQKPEHHVWDLPAAADGHRPSIAVPGAAEIERQISRKGSMSKDEHVHREDTV